jgi:hypothetical protein
MPNKPGKAEWKEKLEAMEQGPPNEPSQPSPQPPIQELFSFQTVPGRQPEPKPGREPEPKPGPDSDEAREIKLTGVSQVSLPDLQRGRLDNLERQMRALKIRANIALPLAILLLLGFGVMVSKGSGESGRIRADDFSINDAKGINRVWVGEREGEVCVELRDQAGRRSLSLGLGVAGEPKLIFYNKDQKILTEIVPPPDGQSGIKIFNQSGELLANIPPPSPPAPEAPDPLANAPLPTPIPQPAKVPSEAPKAEQKSKTEPGAAVRAAESEFFVANPSGKAYHISCCPWVKNIPRKQLLEFYSGAEATKAGYRPCRRCRPDHRD